MAINDRVLENFNERIMNCRECPREIIHPNCTQCAQMSRMIQERELCSNCNENRLPPYLAYVGRGYSESPIKILFVGQIVHNSVEDREMWQQYQLNLPRESYSSYLDYFRGEFEGHDDYDGDYIYKHPSFGIEEIIRAINSTCNLQSEVTLDNIAFTNISKCANKQGRTSDNEIKVMMENCWKKFFVDELKLLKPDIVIPFWGDIFDYCDEELEITYEDFDESIFNLPNLDFSNWSQRTIRIWKFGNNQVKRLFIKFYHPSSEYTANNYRRYPPSFNGRINLIKRFFDSFR